MNGKNGVLGDKYHRVNVVGNSMKPLLNPNDTVYVLKVPDYDIGEIIVYELKAGVRIIHRIVSIDTKTGYYICKGDNAFETDRIEAGKILGKAVFCRDVDKIKIFPKPAESFIILSKKVSELFYLNKKSIRETIRSDIYMDFIRERKMLCIKYATDNSLSIKMTE